MKGSGKGRSHRRANPHLVRLTWPKKNRRKPQRRRCWLRRRRSLNPTRRANLKESRLHVSVKAGLHGQNVEILPDASTLNFANGQHTLAKEKSAFGSQRAHHCSQTSQSLKKAMFLFLMSFRRWRIWAFHSTYTEPLTRLCSKSVSFKGQGIPLHCSWAGCLTLDMKDFCRRTSY